VFVLLGLDVPILDHFLPEILKHAGEDGVRISLPPPTPAQALSDVDSNFSQLGTLVTIIIAAVTLALDAHPTLATFYRTRAQRPSTLLLPRWAVITLGVVACLGILSAWYETAVVIATPPARAP
jgi:ABC-2 type transport system permease protein